MVGHGPIFDSGHGESRHAHRQQQVLSKRVLARLSRLRGRSRSRGLQGDANGAQLQLNSHRLEDIFERDVDTHPRSPVHLAPKSWTSHKEGEDTWKKSSEGSAAQILESNTRNKVQVPDEDGFWGVFKGSFRTSLATKGPSGLVAFIHFTTVAILPGK